MVYDTDLDVTWVADGNLFHTQEISNPNLVSNIITAVGSVADSNPSPHFLTTQDFNPTINSGQMTWWGAQAWVSNLSYGGFSDWRLPTVDTNCAGFSCTTGSEPGHLFYQELNLAAGQSILSSPNASFNLFNNVKANSYWLGNEGASNPGTAWHFENGFQAPGDPKTSSGTYAWAVRSGDVAAVPVPAAAWLFASGLVGLLGLKRRGNIG